MLTPHKSINRRKDSRSDDDSLECSSIDFRSDSLKLDCVKRNIKINLSRSSLERLSRLSSGVNCFHISFTALPSGSTPITMFYNRNNSIYKIFCHITCSTPATSTSFFLLKTERHSSAMVKCNEY